MRFVLKLQKSLRYDISCSGHGRYGERAAETAVATTKSFLQNALADLDTSTNRFPTRQVKRMIQNLFQQIHNDILSLYPTLTTLQWKGQTFVLKQTPNGLYYYINDRNEVFIHDFGTTGISHSQLILFFKFFLQFQILFCV
jgi:hypothetical protein